MRVTQEVTELISLSEKEINSIALESQQIQLRGAVTGENGCNGTRQPGPSPIL